VETLGLLLVVVVELGYQWPLADNQMLLPMPVFLDVRPLVNLLEKDTR
jgi:hypothetical protein